VLRRPLEPKQFTSLRYGERLGELGALPSIGLVGDSYANALAEAVNSLYKSELIRGPGQGPWKAVDDVELATLSWMTWFNTTRIPRHPRRHPTGGFEVAYAHPTGTSQPVGIQ
jgi:putative transposase